MFQNILRTFLRTFLKIFKKIFLITFLMTFLVKSYDSYHKIFFNHLICYYLTCIAPSSTLSCMHNSTHMTHLLFFFSTPFFCILPSDSICTAVTYIFALLLLFFLVFAYFSCFYFFHTFPLLFQQIRRDRKVSSDSCKK